MIEYEERDQAKKNIEVGKPEPETRYQEIIDKIKEKTATTNNAAAQAENNEMKTHMKKKKKTAARAKSENAEARTEKAERICKRITTSDNVVTDSKTMPLIAAENAEVTSEEHPERSTLNDDAGNEETSNETGERHRRRSVLRTVNEDEDFIATHNDLVGHVKDDGMEENKKIKEEPSGSESTPTEATSTVAVVIAR